MPVARDLGTASAHTGIARECEARLRALLDPHEVDRHPKRRQAELIDSNGGWDAVQKKGGFGYSPPPGFRAEFT